MTKPSIEQAGFNKLGQISKAVGKHSEHFLDRIFGRWINNPPTKDWVVDAEWARIQQEPIHGRVLLYTMSITLLGLLVWSAFAPLDEVTRGEGRVIPSQQLQIVQSLDGGIVQRILVTEGQVVDIGDVLISIDQTRFVSSLRESRAQYYAWSAEVSRLQALTNNSPLTFPAELQNDAPDIIEREARLYDANIEELNEQIGIYTNQLKQRQQDLNEATAALEQHKTTLELNTRELEFTRPLLASGAVSDIEILRLERSVAIEQGELNRAEASIQRSLAAIEEARNKIREVELNAMNRWRNQLAETSARLNALIEAEAGLVDKVKQADIVAPVRGTVQRLLVNTVGGVVTPGREVVEIIPLGDRLLIEAKVSPKDIAFIQPGQAAMIKLSAYDFAVYGGLAGEVEHISPDTIMDEQEKQPYYLVRVKTEQTQLGQQLTIIPGMTAQVDIITGKKTVLEYMLKPVLRATSQAMTER